MNKLKLKADQLINNLTDGDKKLNDYKIEIVNIILSKTMNINRNWKTSAIADERLKTIMTLNRGRLDSFVEETKNELNCIKTESVSN